MRTKRKIALVILTFVISFCIFGCKKDNDTGNINNNSAEKENLTLKIHCFSYNTLNPLINDNEANMQMLRLIFEGLVECDTTQRAVPLLAESYKTSVDGLEWSIKLKSNIKWHDESAFNAYDVYKTYSDILIYENKSPYYRLFDNLKEVKVINDYEISFILNEPQVNFINLLDVPIVKYHNGENFKPIGTGPFIVKDEKRLNIALEANDEWHNGKVKISAIDVKVLPDKETATYAYDSKEIDIISITTGENFGEHTSNSDNALIGYPSNSISFISVNTSSEPLNNHSLRKAISYAINKDDICSEVLLSHGSVANTCINSQWWFYADDVTNYKYNKNLASDIISDLKKEIKFTTLNLMVNTESKDKCKAAEMIKSNLEDCGISVYIDYVDWASFEERVSTGNYHMYIGTIKYSSDINPKHIINNPDDRLQRLLYDLNNQSTDDGIKKKYREIQEKINSDIQIIPLYFDTSTVMYNKRISGTLTPNVSNIFNGIENLVLTK